MRIQIPAECNAKYRHYIRTFKVLDSSILVIKSGDDSENNVRIKFSMESPNVDTYIEVTIESNGNVGYHSDLSTHYDTIDQLCKFYNIKRSQTLIDIVKNLINSYLPKTIEPDWNKLKFDTKLTPEVIRHLVDEIRRRDLQTHNNEESSKKTT